MKCRVSIVARDLGVTPRELIQYLNGVGEHVKTPSSLVSLEAANRARIHFSSRARHVAQPPRRRLPATTPLNETETDEISPVDPASGYSFLDAPFWSPALYPAFRQALDWLRSSPRKAPDPRLAPRPLHSRRREREELTVVGRLFLPRGRGYGPDDVLHAMMFARSWEFFGFTHSEIGAWLAAGLRATEAATAALLHDLGITIDRLYEACQNARTKESSTVIEVARRYRQECIYDDRLTPGRFFDEWGVWYSPRRDGRAI